MSLKKLTAGSGYDYLTRQVAALDATEKGHIGLASYYTAKGESPGVWVGSGLVGIDGLNPGDPVTAEQMQALFGSGHHPLARQRAAALPAAATPAQMLDAVRLGQPFRVVAGDVSPFRVEVAKRLEALNVAAGVPRTRPHPVDVRARVRTEVGVEMFTAEFGRPPADARELAAVIAKLSRPRTTAVAGFDLTFSPVKSVSALWALAPREVAACIEQAHQAAVGDALAFLEKRALFSREGQGGVRQVNVTGLVGTAFTHRDSRAGDPDLHTHVAVANKVQTLQGRWLAIDGRVLFKATVAASETYNTALEGHMQRLVGVSFEARPSLDASKRQVREIVGVEPALLRRWSTRRISINARRGELAAQFQLDHGRPPTMVEALALAQQATLETRDAKHEPRSLADQRTAWRDEADQVLGPSGVAGMLHRTLNPADRTVTRTSPQWLAEAAHRILGVLEGSRSVWQVWHVAAEAQRVVRAAGLPGSVAPAVADRLVADVLGSLSVRLEQPDADCGEPAQLRRRDGAPVYSVAGSQLFTSRRILAAELRLVAAAGLGGGMRADDRSVDVALLEATANGHMLNSGQVAMVRAMAQSGARLQLAVAPAGSGKTTAMRSLADAWANAGGTVIGLAPSAAAAAGLAAQTGTRADTVAKLVWSIDHEEQPDWVAQIGPSTLVVIDEAGMADTLSLDAAVSFVLDRGGSVRLIGDDQQLAAIGAGGVLRDIQNQHGALRLNELHRFTDPAEGAASLALRDGGTEALGFYLDQSRVHVGDLAGITEAVFDAWHTDQANGLDALMLAPTRSLVAELNHRARSHRLAGTTPGRAVPLADGNRASVGDMVITRSNRRDLRSSATDWVKNGDRWTVRAITDTAVTVQHHHSRRIVHLPHNYVETAVELGYACTIHAAQGVTADTMHGVLSGAEDRQQLYTMLTRGRHANHIYLDVVGDGDPHSIIHPHAVLPPTATDLIEIILDRDGAAVSATSQLANQHAPALRLGPLVDRYRDALHQAATALADPATLTRIDTTAATLLPGLTDQAGWPALRSELALRSLDGTPPDQMLTDAVATHDLAGADDPAAVLHSRLGNGSLIPHGPLPWLHGLPNVIANHTIWGSYLTGLHNRITTVTDQVHADAAANPHPTWDRRGVRATLSPDLAGDIAVWRAAHQIPDSDTRPTGPAQPSLAERRRQRILTRRLDVGNDALIEWGDAITTAAAFSTVDPFKPVLAQKLAHISASGIDAARLLRTAAAEGVLPDDHPTAALWWRISRHLSPAVAQAHQTDHQVSASPRDHLRQLIDVEQANQLQQSPLWPALVTSLDKAIRRGWHLPHLINTCLPATPTSDDCQALVWRISLLLDPIPDQINETEPSTDTRPDSPLPDLSEEPPLTDEDLPPDPNPKTPAEPNSSMPLTQHGMEIPAGGGDCEVPVDLTVEAIIRDGLPLPEPTDAEVALQMAQRDAWHEVPHTPQRLAHVNQMAADFYTASYAGSWAQPYLTGRFGLDPASVAGIEVGYAPAGWTTLVTHLRRRGVTDDELAAAGLAVTASNGRLIDRFRDRAMFPIRHDGTVLGFVGRRHPDRGDFDNAGPKYLNTADTVLFHKGDQLFVAGHHPYTAHAIPVLVEGPADALAVTIAGAGRYVGVAPLGTSLTSSQARQLHHWRQQPIIATDGDIAGQVAAQRDYWILATHQLYARHAKMPDGRDPAQLVAEGHHRNLLDTLESAPPLAGTLINERITNLPIAEATLEAAAVIAALPARQWESTLCTVADRLQVSPDTLRLAIQPLIQAWNSDPTRAAQRQLRHTQAVQARLVNDQLRRRWRPIAERIDPRLPNDPQWPSLAAAIQSTHQAQLDVADAITVVLESGPLDPQHPAADLTQRLAILTHPEERVTTVAIPNDQPSAARKRWRRQPGRAR